jgi:MerR family transcriptional regulator, thiopeptide resistance regulator
MAAGERTWRIGEVATATGLTVRALHHYDQIGLVVASVRTSGSHRLYTSADLMLLYEVTAMRQLGLSLEQVGILLAERTDVRRVIDQQLEHVDRQIRMAQRLRKQLLAARDADDAGFAEIIRLTGDLTGYLGQEKIDAMHRRIGELGVVAEHAVGPPDRIRPAAVAGLLLGDLIAPAAIYYAARALEAMSQQATGGAR